MSSTPSRRPLPEAPVRRRAPVVGEVVVTPADESAPFPDDPWSEDLWDEFPGGVEPPEMRRARREAKADATASCLARALDAAALRRQHPSWPSYVRTQKRIARVPRPERVAFAPRVEALVLALRDLAAGPLAGTRTSLSWTPSGSRDGVELEARGEPDALARIVPDVATLAAGDAVDALFRLPPVAVEHSHGELHSVFATAADDLHLGATALVSFRQLGGLHWTSLWVSPQVAVASGEAGLPPPPWVAAARGGVAHVFDGACDGDPVADASARHVALVATRNGAVARHGLCFDPLDWGFAIDGLVDAGLSARTPWPARVVPSYRVATA